MGRQIYSRMYFAYKRLVEDPFYSLTEKAPELFSHGHILDVGANIGYTSRIFSRVLNPNFTCCAFEPDDLAFSLLRDNVYSLPIRPIQKAVGNHNGEVEFWHNTSHLADHRVVTPAIESTVSGITRCEITSLDHFWRNELSSAPLSFIKIDVQGYELEVIRGMSEILSNNNNLSVAFEYCPSIMSEMGYETNELIEVFENLDFHFFSIRPKLNRISGSDIKQLVSPGDYGDFLVSKVLRK